ncbi:Polyribonucleotide nucleotidyltransferase [Seminavis robusta]|uniref:polyribonucleotide nucleotidyltransferase n=1 Tax=Seminavis robusta TaxID=568900 RepID=A0A9N8D8S6_9STRA|nr:Polyribonucleotide nucleotidyltransferase [Seminavis robusta]|eukprot:Sro4_g002940.1 Polyribonucleotide nucleotidyltransferase (946) ;mRNA; r:13062-15973
MTERAKKNKKEKETPLFSAKQLEEGHSLKLGTGKLANLTRASVLAIMGDSVVLTTVATDDGHRHQQQQSFQNFTVEYKQRHHGVGKIPLTNSSRRDNTRSTVLETLGSRAIDRALRPLIDNDNTSSIHVNSSVQGLSSHGGNPIVMSINSASAALMSQGMLKEPVAAVSLGVVAGDGRHPKVLVNPACMGDSKRRKNDNTPSLACELLYAGTRTKAVMAEFQYHCTSDGKNMQTSIPEHELSELMSLAHAAIQPLLDTQEEYMQNNDNTPAPETAIEEVLRQENELRASLGLPALTDTAAEQDGNIDGESSSSSKLQKIATELFPEAWGVCENQLETVALALFGYKHEQKMEPKPASALTDYQSAYIHPKDSPAELLLKSTRGKREQIVYSEVERVLTEWVGTERVTKRLDEEAVDDEKALVSILVTKVHKKLLQNALCTTATKYGTRADHRVGGMPSDPSLGFKTIRPLSVTVPALPDVVHGSAIFARGETQVLCTTTLGAPQEGMPMRDPFDALIMPATNTTSLDLASEQEAQNEQGTLFEDLPVGSLRYLRTQEALESDLNTRKSKADREMTGESGNLWEYRRAFLQYDFPSFSTGELPSAGSSQHNRRAIGHGALAEKAILPILPAPQNFPYVMRMTSEVTDSNGSSSMASVCGATLALLDAGVPIVAPVAGVSVGLALPDETDEASNNQSSQTEDEQTYELLLDITGTEDYFGAMDFKIAGTFSGVTAFQLDVKRPIPISVLPEALELARSGRQAILREMDLQCKDSVLQGLKHRTSLKDTAPRVEILRFDPQRKRDLVGPGGAVLRQIEDRYETSLDLTQDGQCLLFGSDKDLVAKAKSVVADLVADVVEGEIYDGTIVEIKDFGAIVELLRNKEGLLHVSELAEDISDPQGNLGAVKKHLKVGDTIRVLCTGVDPVQGSIRLSVKALWKLEREQQLSS